MTECSRANSATLSLMQAAGEVIRSVNNIKASSAAGVSSYRHDLLDRQFRYYKSLGGPATSPEQVRMPDDPCRDAREALQRKHAAVAAEYRQCVASHPAEMKLSALSKEVLSTRSYLAMLERMQQEKRNNPQFDAGKGSEWAAALKADPALVRVELARMFQEYRSAGGLATRIEDVREIPDPCIREQAAAPQPSPIGQKRSIRVPSQ